MNETKSTRRSRDALEVAIRKYGHPAAISDLNSFSESSDARRVFLDATFTMCRDSFMDFTIQKMSAGGGDIQGYECADDGKKADMHCPLARALQEYGIRVDVVSEAFVSYLRTWLGTFGRPTPPKPTMLYQHEARVRYNKEQETMAKAKTGHIREMLSTSKNVTKEHHHVSNQVKWDNLKPVLIRDLKIFESNRGTFLKGKLLVEPFTPMVGCTTIMEDKNGDVLLVALYNFLPAGVSGSDADPIASAKIPKGCKVRIAEPFLKVFKDGSRGVRIDNPSDITVVVQHQSGGRDEMLGKFKANGNDLFQKKLYLGAIECYINGLRNAEFVPTVLSNRSQAFIMVKDWKNAFADAAASLTIRPGCTKTWGRYKKSLEKLEQSLEDNLKGTESNDRARRFFEAALLARVNVDFSKDDNADVNLLKSKGNNAFKSKDYSTAIEMYSVALSLAGKTCRALLSNWAQCCLSIGALNDSLAGSAASLRIAFDEKALYRLCRSLMMLAEPSISLAILENVPPLLKNATVNKKKSKIGEIADAANIISGAMVSGSIRNPSKLFSVPCELYPYWSEDIETFMTGKKGRGVQAKVDMGPGHIVIVEHPIAFSSSNVEKDKKFLMSIRDKTIEDAAQSLLCGAIIGRVQREGLLANIVNRLFDGVNAKPLSPFGDLLPHISSTSPLLPSHHEYMDAKPITISPAHVEGLLRTNSHGGTGDGGKLWTEYSSLYPATSMFNHSKDPTCGHIVPNKADKEDNATCSILVTTRSVKAGEELTVCYHSDEAKAKANWGFKE